MASGSDGKGSDGKGSGGTSGAAAKRKRTWTHNGVEFSSEPYPWKKKLFFAINTGGGMESIYVEEGSHVWAHYEKEDYRMIAGEDNCWMQQLKPNQKNKNQQVEPQDIDDELSQSMAQVIEDELSQAAVAQIIEDELSQAAAQDTVQEVQVKEETGEGKKKTEKKKNKVRAQ